MMYVVHDEENGKFYGPFNDLEQARHKARKRQKKWVKLGFCSQPGHANVCVYKCSLADSCHGFGLHGSK